MKIKSTIYNMRKQPLITAVSIIGSALAIFLIMVLVMMDQIKYAPYSPESNRDRWLVNKYMSISNTNWDEGGQSNGPVGVRTINDVYRKMTVPEAVTAFCVYSRKATLETHASPSITTDYLTTDAEFWKVMDFTFIYGNPYDQAQFDSSQPVAVITQSVARKLFNEDNPVGKEFKMNMIPYRVVGVVKDVSTLATSAYAQVWVPYTSTNDASMCWCQDVMGPFSVIMLPKSKDDIPLVRQEFERLHRAYFESLKDEGWTYIQRSRPYDQETSAKTPWANIEADIEKENRQSYIIFGILLLVPAVNLSSMTHSRLRRQRKDIGIRRAFGATRMSILYDILVENFLITIVAGIIGLCASVIFALTASAALFTPRYYEASLPPAGSLDMLLNWHVLAMAIGFCFVLNLLSAGIPALQASRTNIVNALSSK